jgi:hypothetical protein
MQHAAIAICVQLRRCRFALFAAASGLLWSCVQSQEVAKVPPDLPPLPPPIYQPGELPPLPLPTTAQLRRGRELLEKIVYVVANVPLTSPADVLKVFGFTDLRIREYPTHSDVGPKGSQSDFLNPMEMRGTGLSQISVQPWINDPRTKTVARLEGTIVPVEACVPIEEVRRMFGPVASQVNAGRITDIHPMERPKPIHGVGYLSFYALTNRMSRKASVTFVFDYQTCANDFAFVYITEPKEATK